MLKLILARAFIHMRFQPPSGGCVLKRRRLVCDGGATCQPPSGGCVLKRELLGEKGLIANPAAFGRLCVETGLKQMIDFQNIQPPSGGCVLKQRCASHK